MEYLSVPEYAGLRGCSERYARMLIAKGDIHAVEMNGKLGGGVGGVSYFIPLASIEPKLLRKYQRQQGRKNGVQKPKTEAQMDLPSLEEMSAEERREVARWKNILEEWRMFRSQPGKKEELDKAFVEQAKGKYPDMKISVRILQRHDQALREYGEAALADRRGKHGNHKKAMPDEVFDVFSSFYLDQSRKSVQECMNLTESWLRHEGKEGLLPLPSHQTFTREVMRRILPAELKFCREGEKACRDKMLPSLKRNYDDLHSNSIWVCDNHTFDVFVNDGEHKKPVRVYLTAFQDVRSRKFVGWYVTLTPCSQATLTALRRGIDECGMPDMILSDNGREFLTHDIGGRGFRKARKLSKEEHEIPTILENLGIEFRTAMVRNARAKIIERAFLDVKNNFSKMFEGYTGGTIAERPERLKKTGKDAENFTLLPEFVEYVDKYIRGIFNKHNHYGVGMNGRTPDQVYAECLYEKRVATPEQLNLMMMRNTRMQKVTKEGVCLNLHGDKVLYQSEELILHHFGKKVYVRYNPDDLKEVRVYSDEDRLLCTAQQVRMLSYYENEESLKEAISDNKKYMKAVKLMKKQHEKKVMSELELMAWQAEQNLLLDDVKPNPKILQLHQEKEIVEAGIRKAAGNEGSADVVDMTEAIERLRKAQEK